MHEISNPPPPASQGNGNEQQQLSVALFHETPVRIAKDGREGMFPIRDIATALKYDRQALHQIIERNSEIFAEYRRVNVVFCDDPFKHTCLTRDGVIALISKLDYLRIKDPTKRQRIIEFQRWAAETLGKVMDGTQTAAPMRPWPVVFRDYVGAAQILHDMAGIDRNDAVRFAISLTQKETGVDLSGMIQLIDAKQPAAPAREWVTTEKLARLMDISVRELNTRLAIGGFLTQRYGTVIPSESGRKFARYDQPDGIIWDTAIIPQIPSYWRAYD